MQERVNELIGSAKKLEAQLSMLQGTLTSPAGNKHGVGDKEGLEEAEAEETVQQCESLLQMTFKTGMMVTLRLGARSRMRQTARHAMTKPLIRMMAKAATKGPSWRVRIRCKCPTLGTFLLRKGSPAPRSRVICAIFFQLVKTPRVVTQE